MRSLQELEHDDWGDPPAQSSGLVAHCHRLRRIPVGQLDADELRCLLGQGIGVVHLLPRARAMLTAPPEQWDDDLAALAATVERLAPGAGQD